MKLALIFQTSMELISQINSLVQFKNHKKFNEIKVKMINKISKLVEVETCEVVASGIHKYNF